MSCETFTPIWFYVKEYEEKMRKIQNSLPYGSMLTKTNKKCKKIETLKFHNSLNTFGRHPSNEYARTSGSESVVYFQRRCLLIFFSHMAQC